MSEREMAYRLIDQLPPAKLGYVIGYLQGLAAEEAADDAYCEQLYQAYLQDDDEQKTDGVPLSDLKKAWGLS